MVGFFEDFCNESDSHPCSLISSISRLMWRGSSVNSWPNIWKGFTFHKLLSFPIFDNAVCQFFTFYPTWDPIGECRQAPSEERASVQVMGIFQLNLRDSGSDFKKMPEVKFSLYFTGLQTIVQTKRNTNVYTELPHQVYPARLMSVCL